MDLSPGGSWAGTGLPFLAVRVLEHLVGHPDAVEEAVAAALSAARDDVAAALAALEAEGLAVRMGGSPARWRAAPPRASLGPLLARRREELALAELQVERLHDAYRAAAGRYVASDLFEALQTPEEVAARYAQSLKASRDQVLHLAKPPYVTSPAPGGSPGGSQGGGTGLVWQDGVRFRSVYDTDGLADEQSLETVLRGTAIGGRLRVCAGVPMKLVVFDRTAAIMPLRPDDPAAGSLLIHAPALIDVLITLFESVWERAVPVVLNSPEPGAGQVGGHPEKLDGRTHDILRLLAAGMKDEAVARVLGLSRRTVQKHISDVARALGARTRFQIALIARSRGWLEPYD
ncbi:helix-turn-helix transcriptional regulator [Microbispora sp. RL4-1S]|uniref:Helix-turn-helix transcriptional regulator n=1 Tax=Microbispora oryzae TaxID=2806554 RepID=A0A940WT69_9ACTN|nr:helix-turn-helix transcriptional regulator [Microbispora oryzae]MBP2706980.1 helix-turn-helix transcriptional regulator [Microbispora oryzae]